MENNLGAVIQTTRIRAGLSQSDLANSCHLSVATIRLIEESKIKTPSLKTLKYLANALNLDFQELLKISGHVEQNNEKSLATIIRSARKKAGLSQKNLTKSCDLAVLTIEWIEEGKNNKPYENTLKKLANVLNLDLQELLEICGYLDSTSEKTFAMIIRRARIKTKLSQEELATSCGFPKLTIEMIEEGRTKKPNGITLKKLADVLNLDLQELLKLSDHIENDSKENLATILKNARIKAELSQSDLATLSGLSFAQIKLLEGNKTKKPRLSTLEKLSKALDLDLKELKKVCGYS